MNKSNLLSLKENIENKTHNKDFVSIETLEDLIENEILQENNIDYIVVDNGDSWSVYDLGSYKDEISIEKLKEISEKDVLRIVSSNIVLDLEVENGIANIKIYVSVTFKSPENSNVDNRDVSYENINLDLL